MTIVELGSSIIDNNERCGTDCKYDAEFEEINQEIEKLTSITNSSGTNWGRVGDLAKLILEKKSKNYNIAIYLFYSQLKTNGIKSLIETSEFLNLFLNNFWEDMFPAKNRVSARRNITEWWQEKFEEFLKQTDSNFLSNEISSKIIENLKNIDTFLGDNLDGFINLNSIISLVQEKIVETHIQEPINSSNATKKEEASSTFPQNENLFLINKNETPEKNLQNLIQKMDELCSELSKDGFINANIIKIARMNAWSDIDTLPIRDGNKTLIPPPDDDTILIIDNLIKSGNFKDAFFGIESRLNTKPLWLDLQKYAYDCLVALNLQECSEVIRCETKMLLHKLQGLETLTFSNDMPFANSTTKQWIASLSETKQVDNKNTTLDSINDLMSSNSYPQAIELSMQILSTNIDNYSKLEIYNLLLCSIDAIKNNFAFEAYVKDAIEFIEKSDAARWHKDGVIALYKTVIFSTMFKNLNNLNTDEIKIKYAKLNPLDLI